MEVERRKEKKRQFTAAAEPPYGGLLVETE